MMWERIKLGYFGAGAEMLGDIVVGELNSGNKLKDTRLGKELGYLLVKGWEKLGKIPVLYDQLGSEDMDLELVDGTGARMGSVLEEVGVLNFREGAELEGLARGVGLDLGFLL